MGVKVMFGQSTLCRYVLRPLERLDSYSIVLPGFEQYS